MNSIEESISLRNMIEKNGRTYFLSAIVIIASLGGFLIGYDIFATVKASPSISMEFQILSSVGKILMMTFLLGTLFGALLAGWFADYFGRRICIMISSLLICIGGIILVMANLISSLILGRFILGIGVGFSSMIVPLYLSEIAPPKHRGALVTCNQLGFALGIIAASFINYLYINLGDWRLMFGYSIIFALIQFLGMLFLPESPSWVIEKGCREKGIIIFSYLQGKEGASYFADQVKEKLLKMHQISWNSMLKKYIFPSLLVGIGLSFFQQITGINAAIYQTPYLFEKMGFSLEIFHLFIGIFLIATLLSIGFVDKVGRKKLLLYGFAGMTIALFLLALGLKIETNFIKKMIPFDLALYFFSFGIGAGPITWLVISEVFPLKIRGRMMGFVIFINWGFNFLMSSSYLDKVFKNLQSGSYFLFGILSIVAYIFVYFKVSETKEKSLEELTGVL